MKGTRGACMASSTTPCHHSSIYCFTTLTNMMRRGLAILMSVAVALAASGTQDFDVLLEDMVEKVRLALPFMIAGSWADAGQTVPLRTHSLVAPYVDSDLQNRWWDFGGNAIIVSLPLHRHHSRSCLHLWYSLVANIQSTWGAR